ncbi:hypothetical protein ACP4OV_005865 [Aristida adscensionis]
MPPPMPSPAAIPRPAMPASPSPPSPAPATPSYSSSSSSALATPRRRRRRLLPSKSRSSNHHPSSSASSPFFASPSPFSFLPPTSPSPFHRFLPSPLRASAVPFSWEHRPGIPKTPARARSSASSKGKALPLPLPLPLPPSLLSRSCGGGSDPYASVVPAEYAAAPPVRLGKARAPRRRIRWTRLADALAEWVSVLSLYRSCKRAAGCFAAKAKSPAT